MSASTLHRLSLLALALSSAARLAAADAPPSLQYGSVSVYSENDKYFAGSDQHYTNGFKLSVLSAALSNFTDPSVPAPARWVASNLQALVPAGNDCKLGFSLGQNLYTPTNIHTPTPDPADRPYAAWLYVGAAFQSYTLPCCEGDIARLDTFEVNLGVVGPWAIGREIQNGVHSILGIPHAQGWANQIHNEPGLDLIYERKWRFETTGAHTGLGADLISHVGACLGNIFTYASTGFEVRAGWCLPADFGTNLIRPSGDSNSVHSAFDFFFFGAVDGRAVARDITLDGNSFRSSPSIQRKDFVGDWQAGFGLGGRHWQLTYSQDVRTREFVGQLKSSNFGSISATFFY